MCFVVIVVGKAVYFFTPLPLSKSRLAVMTCLLATSTRESGANNFSESVAPN